MSSVLLKKCSNLDFSPKKPNFEDLPLTVCAACLEFVGNTLEAVFVNKWFLESSYHVYCNIAKTSKGILNWQSCITVKEPSEKQSNSDSLLKWCRYYSDVVHTIHWVLVKKARTAGIKVDDPKKVCLQPLIQKIWISFFTWKLFKSTLLRLFGSL